MNFLDQILKMMDLIIYRDIIYHSKIAKVINGKSHGPLIVFTIGIF